MAVLEWVVRHYDEIVKLGTMIIAVLAHAQALFGIQGQVGKAINIVAGNYGKASNKS